MQKFYILIEPWAVYVKAADFFISQGGLRNSWGHRWQLVEAESIEAARSLGQQMRARKNVPHVH